MGCTATLGWLWQCCLLSGGGTTSTKLELEAYEKCTIITIDAMSNQSNYSGATPKLLQA